MEEFSVMSSWWLCHMSTEQFPAVLQRFQRHRVKGKGSHESCPYLPGLGDVFLSLTTCICFAVPGKVVHLSYVWCPPEQTPLLPLLCLLWLFYKETYSRAREDKATQFRWVLIPMVLIILCVIPVYSRPVKWYFLVVASLGREIILFVVWGSVWWHYSKLGA